MQNKTIAKIMLIHNALKEFTDNFLFNLDCDGSTRFNGILLRKLNIPFVIYEGTISNKKFNPDSKFQKFFPHYWLEVKGIRFDFKAEKWLGKSYNNIFYKHTKLIIDIDKWLTLGENENTILSLLLSEIDKPKTILTIEDDE